MKKDIKAQIATYQTDETLKAKKQKIKSQKTAHYSNFLNDLRDQMSTDQARPNDLVREKHASLWQRLTNWLMPIKDEGYSLTKQQLWDLLRMRYRWQLKRLSANCECVVTFSTEHALSCKKGGFVSLRRNQFWNITAKWLGECCKDVRIEPMLQPLGRECEKVYNRITFIMAEKKQCPYIALLTWIRRKISFAILNYITTCLRGSRCSKPTLPTNHWRQQIISGLNK